MKRNNILLIAVFLSGCVLGGAGVYMWHQTQVGPMPQVCGLGKLSEQSLSLPTLEEGTLPEGMQEVQEDRTLKSSTELPSQLVRADLPEDIVLGGVANPAVPEEEKPSGVVLSDGQNTVVLNAQKPAQRVADGTSITMIEVPVSLKRIKTLEEYKDFKRQARGSYPTADFAKEEILVLESQSNLPDKVFEIISVEPDGENLKLRYRVNVFGLDQKVNTHSVQKISKTKSNIELEQVL